MAKRPSNRRNIHSSREETRGTPAPDCKDRNSNELRPITCPVCYNVPVNPIQITCGHVFCFLCIKSVKETSGRCALCRAEIGVDFNKQDHHILGGSNNIKIPSSPNGYYWFYEGNRGWWLYDSETARELEIAYEENVPQLEKLIAGYLYVINLKEMKQHRKSEFGRSRKICRDTLEKKEILGLGGIRGKEFQASLEALRSLRSQTQSHPSSAAEART